MSPSTGTVGHDTSPGATGARLLVVEDEEAVLRVMSKVLGRHGYEVDGAADGLAAIGKLRAAHYDAVITDVNLPGANGFQVLDACRALAEPPVVLLITGRADVRAAVDAMRRGAADYVEKPIDLDDLAARLERALSGVDMHRRLASLEYREKQRQVGSESRSQAMRDALALAERVAATPNSSALILGESGVGKEVIASYIHERSVRAAGPFVRVNLAAFPESMIEGELFGSVKGAFTDARRDRTGLFASADRGTLLLDELCEFKIELQPKLLRVLQERRFFPVGSDRERKVDVRVLASTNRDPARAVATGRLREDLYFRLATVVIRIPPLRERVEDVVPLARQFAAHFAGEFARPPVELAADAVDALVHHPWPGNVRELRNVMERAIMLCDGDKLTASLLGLEAHAGIFTSRRLTPLPPPASTIPTTTSQPPPPPPPDALDLPSDIATLRLDTAVQSVERAHIERVLRLAAGSPTKTAELLGISRSTLWEKMKRLGIANELKPNDT